MNTSFAYPNSLDDAEWLELEPLLPLAISRRGRPRKHSLRQILDAMSDSGRDLLRIAHWLRLAVPAA